MDGDDMTRRYTDEDVKRLVESATRTVGAIKRIYPSNWQNISSGPLEDALAPFRPDPEEELIEAMVMRMAEVIGHDGESYITGMAYAALAVVKEKGLPT